MVELGPIQDDLAAESAALERVVAALPAGGWATETPAPGWTIAHQIAHLTWTDRQAVCAVSRQVEFDAMVARLAAEGAAVIDETADAGARKPPADLLAEWRAGRAELAATLAAAAPGLKMPWFGPPMSVPSMVTARLMETWAHGQDIFDALGVPHPATERLWHIARLGVRTRDFAFLLHGLAPPNAEFRVELTAPDSTLWTFGPAEAKQRVVGNAVDFCLLVTQRRHLADTDVRSVGPDADRWLGLAQAFAGPPGNGRNAGQFR